MRNLTAVSRKSVSSGVRIAASSSLVCWMRLQAADWEEFTGGTVDTSEYAVIQAVHVRMLAGLSGSTFNNCQQLIKTRDDASQVFAASLVVARAV